MPTTLFIISILLIALTLLLLFRPYVPASATAYAAMLAGQFSGRAGIPDSQLIFWASATVIVLGISAMLPKALIQTSRGTSYISGATITGGIAGLALSGATIITGCAIGAFLGALAYSRTGSGKALAFPSSEFLQFLCAKGLPSTVAVSIICTTATYLFKL